MSGNLLKFHAYAVMHFKTREEAEQNAALMAIIYLEGGIAKSGSEFCIVTRAFPMRVCR